MSTKSDDFVCDDVVYPDEYNWEKYFLDKKDLKESGEEVQFEFGKIMGLCSYIKYLQNLINKK